MANDHDGRDGFNPNTSGMEKAEPDVPTIPISTPVDNSMIHVHASQVSTMHDHLKEKELQAHDSFRCTSNKIGEVHHFQLGPPADASDVMTLCDEEIVQ